ncbi:MAG: hypothetical protein K5877_05695 [Lachnospiraceae bacterium]|nr:hypothetical protein [Lachnospiraceae bacterium]
MISKEEAKNELRKAGYHVVDDNSVITVLIKETDPIKKTVSNVRELLLSKDYHASFAVKQDSFAGMEEEDTGKNFDDDIIDLDEGDLDMLLGEDSVQMSLEDLGMDMS